VEEGENSRWAGNVSHIVISPEARGKHSMVLLATSRFMQKGGSIPASVSLNRGHRQLPVAPLTDHSSRHALVMGGNLHSVGTVRLECVLIVVELRNLGSLTAADDEGNETAQKTDTASAEQDVRDPGRFICLLLRTLPVCCLPNRCGTVRFPLPQWRRRGRRRGRRLRRRSRREWSFRRR